MPVQSLDPRINRAAMPSDDGAAFTPLDELDQLETWEVFHQETRGAHPVHVGSLHAANPETALVFAKEQYARRAKCVGIWVVRTSDVHGIGIEDSDVFITTPSKDYREARGYRVGGKLTAYKRKMAGETNE